MISHNPKFIFVHVPKTAGSSIIKALANYSSAPINFEANGNALLEDKHITAAQLRQKMGSGWDQYFSFAVVRNPWDRVVSNFCYLDKINHPRLRGAKTPSEWVRSGNLWCYPASYYLLINGQVGVNRVIRYENLGKDFRKVCKKIGIKAAKLPRYNSSPHKHFTEYYDDESREIVADIFKQDIVLFKYKFKP